MQRSVAGSKPTTNKIPHPLFMQNYAILTVSSFLPLNSQVIFSKRELNGVSEKEHLMVEKQKLERKKELAVVKNKTDVSVKTLVRFFNHSGFPKIQESKKEISIIRINVI